jgi:hypothetical protein
MTPLGQKLKSVAAIWLLFLMPCSPAIGRLHPAYESSPSAACVRPALPEMSDLVAASDLILVATLHVDGERLAAAARSANPDYIRVRLTSVRPLKGVPPQADPVLTVYPQDRPYAPSNAALAAASDRPSIFFLTQVDVGPVGLYFAGYSRASLQPAEQSRVDAIAGEIARQRRILENWRPDPAAQHDREVARLIQELVSVASSNGISAQQDIFQRIEALGEPAVPAIIAHMDDRRRLAFRQISLANHSADAFESMRHYGPELVVDALDALLNQITGKSFGNIMNGGSERDRRAAVDGWRIYATNLRCARSS